MTDLQADDEVSGLIFDSIVWRGGMMVEISFTEECDRGESIALVKTLVIDQRKSPAYYREFISALVDFVNEGLVILRNPPETVPVRSGSDNE